MPDTPKPLITGPILPPLVPAKVTEGYPPGGEDPNGDFQFLKCNREGYVHTVHQDQLDRIEAKLDQLLSRSPDNRPCCHCSTSQGNETIYCQCNCHPRQ